MRTIVIILWLLTSIIFLGLGFLIATKRKMDAIFENGLASDKSIAYYNLFLAWLLLEDDIKQISVFLKTNKIDTIAIYGYGQIGKMLVNRLKKIDVEVKYIIDKRTIVSPEGIESVMLEDDFEMVDAVVITAPLEYNTICRFLRDKYKNDKVRFVSITEIIQGE